MITYMMDKNKNLIKTTTSVIYQREKLVDKVQFLFPKTYEDIELKDFIFTLKYIDQASVMHAEILTIADENYKTDYMQIVLPLDTNITKFAGIVDFRITLVKYDEETNTEYVLHTGSAKFEVTPVKDLLEFKSDELLESIDSKIAELGATIAALDQMANNYDAEKADDISISDDRKQLQLTANGKVIGTPISLTDLNDATDEATSSETFKVVEL